MTVSTIQVREEAALFHLFVSQFTNSLVGKGFIPTDLFGYNAMSVGYVLINVEPGAEYDVFNAASELPFVVDANLLFGDHDLIVKIEAENMGVIARLVVDNIRSIDGVLNTKTLACAEL